MFVFLFAAVAVLLFGAKTRPRLQYDPSCLARERTSALNGFFVLLVFLSHAVTYVQPAGALDSAYLFVKSQLDQLVVAPFLFFSGYGVLCALRSGGETYLKRFPLHRFGKVLLQSECAVLLFLLTDLCIGRRYPPVRVLLSFTFWESIGNSNWYLFVVLALYVCVFVAFVVARGRLALGAGITSALAVGLVFALKIAGKEPWWYNTLLLFPLGMWFALAFSRLERLVFRSTPRTAVSLAVFGGLFVGLHFLRGRGFVFYELWAAAFLACVVLVMTRVSFGNRALAFFGRHVFGIFMLQRIPMLVFWRVGLARSRYLFVLLSFAATLLLAVGFRMLFSLLSRSRSASEDRP